MIELEALNWSFQLLFYIYDMISGMSRADVKNVLLIMLIDSVILGVVPHTLSIPALPEPPVRILRATIPVVQSHCSGG